MALRAKIVVVAGDVSASERLPRTLRDAAFDVVAVRQVNEAVAQPDPPDLLLVDATARPDVVDTVHRLRERFPEITTPLLVLGVDDTDTAVATIDAGATDSLLNAPGAPTTPAHVRRLLRAADALRAHLHTECVQARRDAMTKAAADIAVPLGALLDSLEAVMADSPVSERLNELLELTSDAVNVVDRLRRMSDALGH